MIFNKVKYSNIGIVKSGKRLPKGYIVSDIKSDNKYIRVRDLNNGAINTKEVQYITDEAAKCIQRYRVKQGDIIISVVGTVGSIAEIDNNLDGAYLTENCDNLLVDESKCLKSYLKYYLLSDLGIANIVANTVGSTQPKLPIYGIENFDILLPNIETQIKIVKMLRSLDDKIKLNNEINNNLHELIKSMYQDFINSLNDTNSVKCEVKKIAKCILGGTPSRVKDEYWNGNINWINSGKINKFRIIEASEYITDIGLSKSSTTLLPKRTTVLAITGATLGQVSRLEIDSCANQSVIGIVPFDSKYNNYIYLTTLNNIDELALRQTGGAQQHINKNDVETFGIIVPNDIDVFDERVKVLFDKISLNCFENKNLEKLRDTLLPKLMNSEIDLENLEI